VNPAVTRDARVVLRVRAAAPWLALAAVVGAGTLLVDRVSTFYSELVLVTLGPLLPAAGLGFSYSASLDVDYELVVASPYPTSRLLLLRAATWLVATAATVLLCGVGLGRIGLGARVLVCAAAVLAVALAASTFLAPPLAAALGAGVWLAVTTFVLAVGDVHDPTDNPGMAVAAAAAVLAAAVLGTRRRVLSTDWRFS
jgi:uncharacterized protein (TIGR03382 family)